MRARLAGDFAQRLANKAVPVSGHTKLAGIREA
jgi:hypothetical protein